MTIDTTTIFHLIPKGVLENTYHGSFKDVISRVRLFEASGRLYRQIILDGDNPTQVMQICSICPNPKFLVEYTYYPETIAALRDRFPAAFIAVRSHNIEPLQHFHNHGWWPESGPLWMGYGMIRLFKGDFIVKRCADAIYSISDWERQKYWQRIPGKARIAWLPYHCPVHLIARPTEHPPVRSQIVCMPTSVRSRKSLDIVRKFIIFAESACRESSEYVYLITGDLAAWPPPQSSAVRYTGMIDDLATFYQTVKAVCILSDLGYGFKTTISDAMANGSAVLVHEKLRRRFASMLGDALISVNPAKPESVRAALTQISAENQSYSHIDRAFQIDADRLLTRDYDL